MMSVKMLASVVGAHEAELAVAGGADIIDFKDPKAGALGALPPEVVAGAVAQLRGRRPTSAVTGDLPMIPEQVVAAARSMAQTSVDYVKVGLFNEPGREDCIRALSSVSESAKLIGVLFADQGIPLDLLEILKQSGFSGVIVDTAAKGRGRLLDFADLSTLRSLVDAARNLQLMVGLAGSLEAPDVPRLLPLLPDVIGFRGALCRGDRKSALSLDAVREIADLVHQTRPRIRKNGEMRPGGLDRVVVEGVIKSMPVGAYSSELGREQRVRFDVNVQIAAPKARFDDMRNAFSYDVVTDAITEICSAGHVVLLETLAEQLAERVLDEPRALRVAVKVTKLDIGNGSVGIEIIRENESAQSALEEMSASMERA
ncbi:dihydroneopterin aldolase [Rhodoligotrophos appendicifer]|uniref:(5-formylfuran-3-yl)methyl phosphate synthase n=1 Tax=Rhodoligotrophos appendicifer TaxID=987056 RepID=UPI0014789C4E|nr:(5-formylfuran-3-yl)methyl phosphate synthase [Rhodoligotrophos appendicifer]